MEGLEGTVKTPFGTVSKKTALMVGGGVVVLAGIVYYRSKKAKNAAAVAASGANTGINPATGYPYGSAEDAAALANQASYITPGGGGGGGAGSGGAGYPTGPGKGFTNNAEWVQSTITYMVGASLVSDPSALSAALGRYITGSPIITGDMTLINMAIAANGYPPVSGNSGYPPAINTSHPADPPPPPPVVTPPPPPVTPPPPAVPGPVWQNVFKYAIVDDWVNSTGVDWGTLVRLNPGLPSNVTKNMNPRKRVFIYNTAYRIR